MMRKVFVIILTLFFLGVIASLHSPQAQALIYVGNSGGNNIPTFPNNATGSMVPTTNIQGAGTTFNGPQGLAVDASFIYVANSRNNSIDVFPIGASGNVAPTRSIQGAATTLRFPKGVAVDSNFIYVANTNNNSIDVFPIGATGDVAPTRSIQGAATTLIIPSGVAVDASFIYVVNFSNASIDVFPIGTAGDVAPTRSIQGAATTLSSPHGVAVDASFIYVANLAPGRVGVFPIGAAGDVAPTRSIQGFATSLDLPHGVTVDANFIYVANSGNSSIGVFPINATGDVAPTRSIQSAATTLSQPVGVAVDARSPVTSRKNQPGSLLVFPLIDNIPPNNTIIEIANTDLGPNDVVLDCEMVTHPLGDPAPPLFSKRDFRITLTPKEVFWWDTGNSIPGRGIPGFNGDKGFLFCWAVDGLNTRLEIEHNFLKGDAVVFGGGLAFQYNAIPHQGLAVFGDRILNLNGVEYTAGTSTVLFEGFVEGFAGINGVLAVAGLDIDFINSIQPTANINFSCWNEAEQGFSTDLAFYQFVQYDYGADLDLTIDDVFTPKFHCATSTTIPLWAVTYQWTGGLAWGSNVFQDPNSATPTAVILPPVVQ